MRLRRHGLVEAEEVGDAAKSRPRAVQTQHANAMVNHQDEAVPAWFTKAMNEHNRLINERFAAFNERLVELSVQLSELDEYASDIEVQQAKLMAMSRQDIRKAKYTPNVRAAIMPKLPPSQSS